MNTIHIGDTIALSTYEGIDENSQPVYEERFRGRVSDVTESEYHGHGVRLGGSPTILYLREFEPADIIDSAPRPEGTVEYWSDGASPTLRLHIGADGLARVNRRLMAAILEQAGYTESPIDV